MVDFERIDDLMQDGYTLVLENDYCDGCDKWLEAWDVIKKLFVGGIAKDIFDLDKKYSFTEMVCNYVQDLEIELHNAGLDDNTYHQKRANYCRELLEWCGDASELLVDNTRRGMADAYFNLGEADTGEQLYKDWLQDNPDWGWGYIGWSDYYHFTIKQYERAEEILLAGYAREGLRDRTDLLDRLADVYSDMGKPDKAKEITVKSSALKRAEAQKNKPLPVRVVKIGRNDPCPCGSGKKYKKCCGP